MEKILDEYTCIREEYILDEDIRDKGILKLHQLHTKSLYNHTHLALSLSAL